ncbi:SLOG family protein [Virgibacillus sp. DJP39]|uniref:SLOG family protein n=1 Tax=Virgibacillus sp. DJP39 TaxID=3409790 RepID=UPI003BB76115
MKVLTVTGYKSMELGIFKEDDHKITFIKSAIKKKLLNFADEGLEWVLISGQMGVEMWTGQVVLELKETHDIKIGIIPPFEKQESRWPEPIQQAYQELVMAADFHQFLHKGEYKGAFQFKAKNDWFVDKSDACLILLDDEFPGSNRFFYEKAKQARNYPIYLITPTDLDDAVEELRMADPDYWS